MKKAFFAILLTLSLFLTTHSALADDPLPQAIIDYVKAHPNATPQEIQDFANSAAPSYTQQFKSQEELIQTINNNGSKYAFGGSKISAYLKNTLQSPKLGVWFIITSLFISAFLGALHALTPGHGKTMVAAYLVGSKGRWIDAVILSAIVTLTHTSSVIALGLVSLFASQYILPQTLFPWLSLISGLTIVGLGLWLLYKRIRSRNGQEEHNHGPGGHTHGPDGHSHGVLGLHNHTHETIASKPGITPLFNKPAAAQSKSFWNYFKFWQLRKGSQVSLGSLISLGISGGIVPCPDALVVLLIAIALNRIIFGLVIVLAFSVGLAAVLIIIGLLIVLARPFMERVGGKNDKLMKILPIGSAVAVTIIGAVLVSKAILAFGF